MDTSNAVWVDLRFFQDQASSHHCLSNGWSVCHTSNSTRLHQEIRKANPTLLCFEYDYPDASGLSALRQARHLFPSIPIIMITEQHSEALAVWALRIRVWDYFIKPLQPTDLAKSATKALNQDRVLTKNSSQAPQLNFLTNPIPQELRFRPKQKKKTNLALFFVESHYHENICEESVAKLCGLNISTFSRSFKREHKENFRDYLINFRINKSKELLQNPNASVADVAYTVGFHDPSYFTRTFRRIVGMSPSQYREVSIIH